MAILLGIAQEDTNIIVIYRKNCLINGTHLVQWIEAKGDGNEVWTLGEAHVRLDHLMTTWSVYLDGTP